MVLKRAKQKGISFGYCDTVTGQRVYPVPAMTDLLPEQQPPEPKPAYYPDSKADDDMYLKITCSPSLGQATQIARTQHSVRFAVLLETSSPSLVEQDDGEPQVCLWHNHNGHYDWSELALKPTKDFDDVLLINRPQDRSLTRTWFMAELPGLPKHAHVVSFTVKFRVSTSKGWKWVKDTTGAQDGELHYQSHDYQKHATHDLKHFFSDVSSDIAVQSERPDTDETFLYSLTAPVDAAQDEDSSYQHHRLGKANHCSRWFALVRLWSPWLAPRQGKARFEVDKDAVLVSFLRSDGMHVVCLGISGVQDVMTTFVHDEDGNIIVKARNDRPEKGTSRVIVAVADTFEVANAAVMYAARKLVMALDTTPSDSTISDLIDEKMKPEWLEEWYDGLTYCTWNGLGQDLTADKVYNALDELSKQNINVTNLILDDNTQSLSTGETQFKRGWTSFEANKEGFPEGYKATTAEIRRRHPNIRHIGIWHAILGYWGGVDPDGEIAKRYKVIEVEKEPGPIAGGKFHVVAAEDVKRLYDDYYRFLSDSGVDSVKTDAQFFLDLLLHAPDRRALTTEYQDAWTIAHLRYFSSRAISCMSQSPQILFHSQLPTNKPRLLVRNSDDFFPEVPASHPWHIFCNAHNALLNQHLNVLPDWDMFQTSHPWAGFHAAARCISGGPIYFTDTPGKHDIKLIRAMTAQTTNDKTVILRPNVGKAMDPYNAYDSQAILRVGTYVGFARTGAGILGVFNCGQQHISEFVLLEDFLGTEEGEYVVGSFVSGEVSTPMSRKGQGAMVGVELEVQGWDVLTAYSLHPFEVKGKAVKAAIMGLVGKMTGSAAVTGCDMYVESNGRLRIWTSLKALGTLGLYVSSLESKSIEKDFMIIMLGKPIPLHCCRVSDRSEQVLEVDVERAWRESGAKAGWSNEVSLEVFMS